MPHQPKISVLIPVYNAEAYLAATLESLRLQDFQDFEVICVDDGSKDASLSVLQSFKALLPQLVVVSRPNTGIVGALNDGLAAAKGLYIARLDADDLCAPERLRLQNDYLDQHADVVALGSSAALIDAEERPLGEFSVPLSHEEIELRLLTGASAIHHPAAMIRADALRRVGGYREGFCPAEDYDLWLRLGEVGKLCNLAEPLITKRQTTTGLVATRIAERDAIVNRALADAWGRRQLTGEPPKTQPTFHSLTDIYKQWGWLALKYGHVATARYYALKLLSKRPVSKDSLKLFFCALRGH